MNRIVKIEIDLRDAYSYPLSLPNEIITEKSL